MKPYRIHQSIMGFRPDEEQNQCTDDLSDDMPGDAQEHHSQEEYQSDRESTILIMNKLERINDGYLVVKPEQISKDLETIDQNASNAPLLMSNSGKTSLMMQMMQITSWNKCQEELQRKGMARLTYICSRQRKIQGVTIRKDKMITLS